MAKQGEEGIIWCDETWNPIRGCSRVSEGCRNCYAESVAARFSGKGQPYEGLAIMKDGDARWTGKVQLVEKHVEDPLRWRRPRLIFVNSMSDLFHEAIPDSWIARIFSVMGRAKHHTFQVLTKRPERMKKFLLACGPCEEGWVTHNAHAPKGYAGDGLIVGVQENWPLKNVWLGVSAEDQTSAHERVPLLLQTPARVRWVSYEPALGPIDFSGWLGGDKLNWIVAGGESGHGARPMQPEWARSSRDQCVAAGVPYFFKQWGEHHPITRTDGIHESPFGGQQMVRVGKKAAGRMLDGREWREFPQ